MIRWWASYPQRCRARHSLVAGLIGRRPSSGATLLLAASPPPPAVPGRRRALAVPGYVLGLVLGGAAAAASDLSAVVRRTAAPFAIALRCVPIVAIAPLLVQAFGRRIPGTSVTRRRLVC
ncbi:MAG: hypothetical protein ABIR68_11770 [Ilumatobacteraceae bacterium]